MCLGFHSPDRAAKLTRLPIMFLRNSPSFFSRCCLMPLTPWLFSAAGRGGAGRGGAVSSQQTEHGCARGGLVLRISRGCSRFRGVRTGQREARLARQEARQLDAPTSRLMALRPATAKPEAPQQHHPPALVSTSAFRLFCRSSHCRRLRPSCACAVSSAGEATRLGGERSTAAAAADRACAGAVSCAAAEHAMEAQVRQDAMPTRLPSTAQQ